MRVIALKTALSLGIKKGYTYDIFFSDTSKNEEYKSTLVDIGMADYYVEDDLVSGISEFNNKPYNKGMQCSNYKNIYKSLVDNTNPTFDINEWKIISCSVSDHVNRSYASGEQCFYGGKIFESIVNTSNTWIPSEWEQKTT